MGRKSRIINLSESEKTELLTRANASSLDYRAVVRARIILMSAENKSYKEIADKLNVGTTAISKWKSRYLEYGLAGLQDSERSGAPAKYNEIDKARVIQKACSKPEGGYSR